jgi:ABC-type glycerol-3-phosphate transport system permease component
MSEQLTICLIAVAVNLGGMLIVSAILSHFLARIAGNTGGVLPVIVLLVLSQILWIAPAIWIVGDRNNGHAAAYALWFGNWLVSGFSVVLLLRTTISIPVALRETARVDGLNVFGEWQHTVFPFVRRDLTIITLLTLMATLLPFWGFINLPQATDVITIFERTVTSGERLVAMLVASLVGTLPLIAIFFVAKRNR